MNKPKAKVHRAFSSACFALILCASQGLAQRPATRHAERQPNQEKHALARPHGGGLSYAANRYMLFLADDPVASHFATREQLQTAAAVSYRQRLQARQQSLMQDLAGRKIQVVGSASLVMNAVFVVAPASRLAELRSLSGVIGVMPERRVKPTLNKATSLVNAPAAWAQSAIGGQSNAGNGIKIAILDTGIDAGSVHTNPAFSDAGFTAPSGFPKCNAAVNGTPSDCGLYTNNKVIVARSYVSMIAAGNCGATSLTGVCTSAGTAPAATSMPDDYSARDRDGHGSAVAAAAAAVQNSNGAVAFSGMAPKAFLGSYKIYGSDGVSYSPPESVIIQALDDAIADGMNVVNFSWGTPAVAGAMDDVQCGNPKGVWCDPLAHAFETAARNGTVITAGAGDFGGDPYGDLYYNTILSPANAPSVIAVGASINSHVFSPTVSVGSSSAPSSLKGIAAALGDAEFLPWTPSLCNASASSSSFSCVLPPSGALGALSAPLIDVATLGNNGQACSALTPGSLTDSYALIQQSASCTFDAQAINATNAGAIGIIFYMASSGPLTAPDQTCYDNSNGDCDLAGPGVMISQSDGQNLKTYIDANAGAVVTIDTAGAETALPGSFTMNTLATYSSEGPAIDGSLKPDIVATGGFDYWQVPPFLSYGSAENGLYTVGQSYDPNGELYTSSGYIAANGTSLAAPLVAGAAAMVLQAHPGWSALAVKSALVNNANATAITSDDNGDAVDVLEIGGGLLDANAAVTASVTAVPSTLSFGYVASGTTLPVTIPVTVTNSGSASVTLTVAVTAGAPATGATVTVSSASVTIAAGATGTFNASLTGAVPAAGEYNGAVTLTATSPAVNLHLPYVFLVGDGANPVSNPLYDMGTWQTTGGEFTVSYGAVNQDIGPIPVQLIDEMGVPVANSSVTYSVSPSGTATMQAVAGTAGTTGNAIPFQPSKCSPASSTSTMTCTTNNYGIAWAELVAGATAVGSTNPATIDITTAAGNDVTEQVSIVAAPSLTKVYENNAGGSTLAPGSYVQLSGSDFTDPNYMEVQSPGDKVDVTYTGGRLPLTWEYVTVSFDAPASGSLPAISVPGYVEFVSGTKVNVLVPWELEGYPSVQVKETYAGTNPIYSNVVSAPLATYTPTFFMYYPGSGSALIADAIDPTSCPTSYIVATNCPAAAGDLVEFYANGLGETANQPASGTPAPGAPNFATTNTKPVVMIGGQPATVQFAGLAPGYVGLYQVNAFIPSGLSSGNQPITISIGGVSSPGSITSGSTTYQVVLPIK